tara:strand:- start:29216 stop:29335 length:120 start_codon:yes stop_codon:yes gene_type:complete
MMPVLFPALADVAATTPLPRASITTAIILLFMFSPSAGF